MAQAADLNSFTYQEINRQPDTWKRALEHLVTQEAAHRQLLEKYQDRIWVFSGCGTSYYLAQTGAALFEMVTGIRTKAVPGSEILMYPELVFNGQDKFVLVPISRSGTTSEILWATQLARKSFSVPVIPVSCDGQSPLAREGADAVTFPFEAEKSTVMTGSFTTMLLSIICLGIQGARKAELQTVMGRMPEASRQVLRQYAPLAEQIASQGLTDFVFLAQGPQFGIVNEAALKLKEMSLAASICYHALEFRHGPMSVVTDRTLVTILFSQAATEYEWALARDMKKLGAKVFLLQEPAPLPSGFTPEFRLLTPAGFGDLFATHFYLPTIQLLGYYLALGKGLNPDSPKNLSPVVKLEAAHGR